MKKKSLFPKFINGIVQSANRTVIGDVIESKAVGIKEAVRQGIVSAEEPVIHITCVQKKTDVKSVGYGIEFL